MSSKFQSILSDVGTFLKKVFTGVTAVAAAAEPIVDVAYPGIAPLYSATVAAAVQAESAAVAAGQQTGTGTQKLALVVSAIEKQFNAFASANGIGGTTTTTIENWVNAVVASLNAIPSIQAETATGDTAE